ncbi:MAG: K(+)-transporting ATPase subunit C, partial [Devosia sp.]
LGIGQAVFPAAANGSVVTRDSAVVGSALIGQSGADPRYFWPRPSAAGNGYDAANSSGSNLGPTSRKLMDRIGETIGTLRAGGAEGLLPADAVTASGSGLDPDISPDYARVQIARVARERALSVEAVEQLVTAHVEGPFLGFFGEARVNVLNLNLALDATAAPGG